MSNGILNIRIEIWVFPYVHHLNRHRWDLLYIGTPRVHNDLRTYLLSEMSNWSIKRLLKLSRLGNTLRKEPTKVQL